MLLGILCGGRYNNFQIIHKVRCDQLKNKSSRRVTYANSIYFLNDRSVYTTNRLVFEAIQTPVHKN
ncbi:unnamed protein product [Tenebrio molitor]|nr:unnamed protein product [Tenebrio molitor]